MGTKNIVGELTVNGNNVATISDMPTKTSQLTNDSGFITSAVTSVNGSTGAITNVVMDNTATVLIGLNATSKTNDVVLGNGAISSRSSGLAKYGNVSIGQNCAGYGNNTVAIGTGANVGTSSSDAPGGVAIGDTTTVTGQGGVAIGKYAKAIGDGVSIGYNSDVTDSYGVAIGYLAQAVNATALGKGAEALGSASTALGMLAETSETDEDVMQLGKSSTSALRCKVALTITSDERDKTDIANVYNALDFITKLNPVTFVSNERVEYINEEDRKSETYRKYGMCEYDREAHAQGTKKGTRRRIGLLAQETQQVLKDVYGTDNYANIVNDNFYDLEERPIDVENKLTLAYANLVPFLIGAIKEQQAQIEELKAKLGE